MREAILNGAEDAALYVDMDVIVPEQALHILDEHGLFTNIDPPRAENQIFGFRKERSNFLTEHLMPTVVNFMIEEENGWRGHVDIFSDDDKELQALGLTLADISLQIECIKDAATVKESYQKPKPFIPSLFQFLHPPP